MVTTSHKPDFTAWFVLQGTIATMELPAFYDEANAEALKLYKILALEAGKTRAMARIIHKLPYHLQYKIGEFVTNSGRLRHFYLRKKEIEKQSRKLLESGDIKQVIVLGAGLDILALRLAGEYSSIKFIEIDRAESQEFKLSALAANNIKIPENMELVSGDLREPLAQILSSSRFNSPLAKTLWICEGLFMFIPKEYVVRIFQQMQQNSESASYSIFTTLAPKGQGSALAKMIQSIYMSKEQCSYYWTIDSSSVPEFMQKLNFKMLEQINCQTLHSPYPQKKTTQNIGDDIHIVKS